jgi:hypothetical protein
MRILNTHLVSSNPLHLGNTLATPDQQRAVVIATSGTIVNGQMSLQPAIGGTLSASFSTPGVDISHLYGFAVSAVLSGSITGSVSLYGACSPGYAKNPPDFASQTSGQGQVFLDQGISDWVQIPGAMQQLSCSTLGGPSTVLFNVSQQFYKWVQVQWSHNAGTGSIDVFVNGKGNRE